MFVPILFFAVLALPLVHADWWDDFSNNLATDLAPFLSLFAVVSAIRVCGSPSLRAFIGKAQEGGGNAEAELCSSTSRDVCKLYNNGGIARVFGRPKILEIVYDPDLSRDAEAGIYTFQEYLKGKGKKVWERYPKEKETKSPSDEEAGNPTEQKKEEAYQETFAPNLSLNVGIKRKSPAVFWAVAMVGLILQAGVLVFAAIVTYYLQWEIGGSSPEPYACPLTIIGTVLVCGGIFFCAFLVGQSTKEQVFRRKGTAEADGSTPSSIYWVQPGGQVLGDQIFDPFSCSDRSKPLQEYITSSKTRSKNSELAVWAAVGTTISGFVLQFIGLRGIHSGVSVAQLGAIMVMSAARAALRMQRLKTEDNFLAQCPDEVVGHELDWLALHIGREDIQYDLDRSSPDPSPGPSSGPSSLNPQPSCLWRFCGVPDPTNSRIRREPPSSSLGPHDSTRYFWRFCGVPDPTNRIRPEPPSSPDAPNTAGKLLAYRTRLAQLTESLATQSKSAATARNFDIERVEVRLEAQRLAVAIEAAVNTIFSMSTSMSIKIQKGWETAGSMWWGINCDISKELPTNSEQKKNPTKSRNQHLLYLQLSRDTKDSNSLGNPWRLENKRELEGLLGLWIWSLKSDPAVETKDSDPAVETKDSDPAVETEDSQSQLIKSRAVDVPARRIVATDPNITDLRIWLGGEAAGLKKDTLCLGSTDLSKPGSVWERSGSNYEPLRNSLPKNFQSDSPIRFFSWHAAKLPQTSEPFEVWSAPAPTSSSLLSLCVQEVFSSFIKSILKIVDDVGDINLPEEIRHFHPESSLVSEIVKLFTERQLGSREEALLCVFPPMLSRLRLLRPSSARDALEAARKFANQHRRAKEWKEADAVLQWAWGICTRSRPSAIDEGESDPLILANELTEQAAIALGELYRWALVNKDNTQFGTDGIKWLQQQKSNQSEPTCEAIDRYDRIAKGVAKPRDNVSGGRLISAIKHGRDTTLLHLTQSISMTYEEKGKALCLAAKHRWAEVVLALLELTAERDFKDSDSRTALSYAA
ncbi:Hemopexin/matrixin conserved site [Zalerion maritima]|uniref:Hemopexin/matrixin conserved site n=1 Tax=Zalerion maritima TaxID=339359 RepID=A0AAD5RSE4_9PEZI|nr:Hemopexin/matrixin conserved site [Zalerion maritima]